VSGPLLNPFCS